MYERQLEGSGRKPRYMCRVKKLMMTVFPVARLIEGKADASSTVNQSVLNRRVVYRVLKFDPIDKSAVYHAKYLTSEIEFEKPYLLRVSSVFAAFTNFWRPFWAIFCLTVDATSCQSQYVTKQLTRRRIE